MKDNKSRHSTTYHLPCLSYNQGAGKYDYNHEKKTIEKKVPEMTDILRLSYKDFKTSIINMFKNFKKR